MPIPDYQSCMMPLLKIVNDGQEHRLREVVDALAEQFDLTSEERAQKLPSGKTGLFYNRVGWAKAYLNKAGLMESPARGIMKLTEEGRRTADSGLERIDTENLKQYPSFQKYIASSRANDKPNESSMSPDDFEDLLRDFSDIANDWFAEHSFVVDYNNFMQDFFQLDNLGKIEWPDIQELGENIHSLQRNALAKARAFGNPNYPIHQYRESFRKLAHGEGSVEDRMRWFLTSDSATNKYLGASSVSEIIGQLHADTHVFFNKRDEEAARFLGMDLGFTRGDDDARRFAKFNQAIRSIFDSYREIVGSRTNGKIGLEVDQFFSWLYETKELGKNPPKYESIIPEGHRVWEFAPGRGAIFWEEFQNEGVAALGWDKIGDLRNFNSREEMAEAIKKEYTLGGEPRNSSLALWQWLREVKPGHIILAKKGRKAIVGKGVVTGEYEYNPERGKSPHVRKVQWDKNGQWRLPQGQNLTTKTLTDLTPYPEHVRKLMALIEDVTPPAEEKKYWWINCNPSIWDLTNVQVGHKEMGSPYNPDGKKRKIFKYFGMINEGDEIVGYVTSPVRRVTSLLTVTKSFGRDEGFEFEVKEHFTEKPRWEALREDERLSDCEPLKGNQGSLFSLTEDEFIAIRELAQGDGPDPGTETDEYTEEDALEDLFMDAAAFKCILDRLESKRNVILQGPPGVGKTFVAKRVAYTLMGEKDHSRVRMIQFHQSYSYEDFIRGYRPADDGGFSLKDGIFYQFCMNAQKDDRPYVFIIDEINRGNISKVFGELMMLIEHDKRTPQYAVPLAYQREGEADFHVPGNVYIIGLMNTADRSLAMVDYALRRRFSFINIEPAYGTERLGKKLVSLCGDSLGARITEALLELNKKIAADTDNLGPGFCLGHSYFCLEDTAFIDGPGYWQIVETEIAPLLREYWFDQPKIAEDWINRLRDIAG